MSRFPLHKNGQRDRGFTVFELMVVITVALILSLIFIYSSHHLIITTKISRVKEEHKVLARALQNYQMDYNDYPNNAEGLKALSAPTAYLASLPSDPFLPGANHTYAYYYEPGYPYNYILISAGPDGDLDFYDYYLNALNAPAGDGAAPQPSQQAENALQEFLRTRVYDPTNGLNSDGDIVTLSRM
jgi:prepilin-type N-terminal cleavage/methylation domain-containing protein